MSDVEIVLGRRYRITQKRLDYTVIHEGVVVQLSSTRSSVVFAGANHWTDFDSHDAEYTVELLPDPLPVTPGSVIQMTRYGQLSRYMLSENGIWYCPPNEYGLTPEDIDGYYVVLFVAPEMQS